ncbi:divergent PAP2 family protein [candidate division WOR-3 bacterium]|nr:divergent PAP2 family protein [candidate division WOR-3 bacterium]
MGYRIIILTLLSGFFAQAVKFFISFIIKKRPNFKRLVETGGMPSSHSTGVMTLSTCIGIKEGFTSPTFAITLFFSLVIMYEAAGLRRAAGRQAELLNRIVEGLYKREQIKPVRLSELLGHTPLEVILGGILGIVFALAFF